MEKGNGSRIIAVVALVFAVVGLSIGFAAYTSTLNIAANANVTATGADWDVGFADATSGNMYDTATPTSVNGTGVTNAGSVNIYKYTVQQNTAATIPNTANSSVTYAFKIKNAGSLDAILDSITGGTVSCSYDSNAQTRTIETDQGQGIGEQVTAETGTFDCSSLFTIKVTIDGTDYTIGSLPQSYNQTIDDGTSVDASLTITRNSTAPATPITGDFVVTLANTTVVYKSN